MFTSINKYSEIYQKCNFLIKISLCLLMHITLFLIKIDYQNIPFNILLFLNLVFLMIFFILFIIGLFLEIISRYKFYNLKKEDEKALPHYLLQLAKEMDVDIKTYQESTNLRNAGIRNNKKLIIGDIIMDTFSKNEITAIVAHEFGHIKSFIKSKSMLIIGTIIPIYLILYYSVHINKVYLLITDLSYIYIIMFPFFWDSELFADAIAIRYASLDDLHTALSKLSLNKINSYSFFHPSITYRIERLKRMKEGQMTNN